MARNILYVKRVFNLIRKSEIKIIFSESRGDYL